jgi:hypothetical protein
MKILIVDTSNQREIFEIDEYDKVKVLKEKIQNKKGINDDIILHFNGEIIDEEETIHDYDIKENETIIYLGKFRAGI